MKLLLKSLWRISCTVLAVVFLFSCFSQFIPARTIGFTVFFALLFPYLFVLVFGAAIINIFINKKWALAFFLLLLPGLYNFFNVVAISPLSNWKMKKDTNDIRIMTWNVSDFGTPAPLNQSDGTQRKQMIETISEYNPDIICVQEYYNIEQPHEVRSVRHELDSIGYPYSTFSGDQEYKTYFGIEQRGVAIFSKTPLLKSGRLQTRKDFKTEYMSFADILLQNKPVRIATAHLTSFYLFPDSAKGYQGKKLVAKKIFTYKQDVEMKLLDIEALHDEQAALINSFLDTASYPVVYCGDCNATSTMYSYRILKGEKQDAFLKKGNGIGATFYNIAPTLRIDMCFPNSHFEVKQCTVVQRKLGDHYPVVTDIAWKKTNQN